MKGKESKIPLLLTLIALGFFIHWAVGYVQKHRPPQTLEQAPIEAQAKEAPLAQAPPTVTVDAMPQSQPTEMAAVQRKPAVDDPEAQAIMPHGGELNAQGRPVNRKLLGLIEASGRKG